MINLQTLMHKFLFQLHPEYLDILSLSLKSKIENFISQDNFIF